MIPIAIPAAIELAKFLGPKLVRMVAGDKAGNIAQAVADHAQAVTGTDTPEDALEALRANPEDVLAFKGRVLEHIEKLEELDVRREEMRLDDVSDARERDEKLRAMGWDNQRADRLIVGDIIGLLACLGSMLAITWFGVTSELDPAILAMNGPIGTLAGFFGAGLRDAHQFEFGSSRGSKEKDAQAVGVETKIADAVARAFSSNGRG